MKRTRGGRDEGRKRERQDRAYGTGEALGEEDIFQHQ